MTPTLTIRRAALSLVVAFLAEGVFVGPVPAREATVQTVPAGEAFTVSKGTQVAAATTTKRKRRSSRYRSRRRHAQAPLRLPAVTPYGIPRLHVKAAYVFS